MTSKDDVETAFSKLKAILKLYAAKLVVVADTSDTYYLDTAHLMKNKKPLFFGSVKKARGHVSFHLMPVYLYPDLLESVSSDLKRSMSGKSCFKFRSIDQNLLKEIERVAKAGFAKYKAENYVQ